MLYALNALGCMSHCSTLELGDQTQAGSSGTVQGGLNYEEGKKYGGKKRPKLGFEPRTSPKSRLTEPGRKFPNGVLCH